MRGSFSLPCEAGASHFLTDIAKSQPFPANDEHSCKTCFKGLSLSKLLSVMELLENSMLDSQLLEPGAEVSALAQSLSNSSLGCPLGVTLVSFWYYLGVF